jgi:hypothetical protein
MIEDVAALRSTTQGGTMRKALTLSQQARTIATLAETLAHEAGATEEARELRLAGMAEAVEILSIRKYRINQMRPAKRLTEPVAELACGPVWRVEDIEAFDRLWFGEKEKPSRWDEDRGPE